MKPTRHARPTYSPARTLGAAAAVLALVAGALLAVSHPVATVAAVAGALLVRRVAGTAQRRVRRRLRRRRAEGRTRQVCVPSVGVCVEA